MYGLEILKVELASKKATDMILAKILFLPRLISFSKRSNLSLKRLYMKNSPEKFGSIIQRPSQILIGAVGSINITFSIIQKNLKNSMAVILMGKDEMRLTIS